VLNFDLKDYFPSISYRRVRGLFIGLGYGWSVACALALTLQVCPSDSE